MADQDSGHTCMQLFCSVGGADGVVVRWWWVGLLMMGRGGVFGLEVGPGTRKNRRLSNRAWVCRYFLSGGVPDCRSGTNP